MSYSPYGDDKPEPRFPEPLDIAAILRQVAHAIDRPSERERKLARDLAQCQKEIARLMNHDSELSRALSEARARCDLPVNTIVLRGAEADAWRAVRAALCKEAK